MMPKHHPDEATLLSYAAGSLTPGASLLMECHLARCEHCQARVREAEQLGGQLLENLQISPMAVMSEQALFALLDEPENQSEQSDGKNWPVSASDNRSYDVSDKEEQKPDWLPEWANALLPWVNKDTSWQRVAPGISQIRLQDDSFARDKAVRLLKIAPGTCMPGHGHSGSELTLILQGSYSDENGRFCEGDVADLDPDIKHQPIADRDQDCICLIVTDAPLRFDGWVPRLMQPFFGL